MCVSLTQIFREEKYFIIADKNILLPILKLADFFH